MYEIFKKELGKKGKRPADIVKETGIQASTFSDWKKGKSNPNTEKMIKIANFLGVSVEYLMTGEKSDLSDNKYYINEETADVAQEIFENDKILFDTYRSVNKD